MDKDTANMLGSVGGSVVSAGLGMLDSHLSRRYNERMIDKQNAWNLAQWHRENAYNAPSAVVQRLKNANINPALAYMNGASFAPAATSPQSGASQARSFGMQIDPMTLSNIRLQEAQARDLEESAKGKEIENEDKGIDLRIKKSLESDGLLNAFEKSKIYQQFNDEGVSEVQALRMAYDYLIYTDSWIPNEDGIIEQRFGTHTWVQVDANNPLHKKRHANMIGSENEQAAVRDANIAAAEARKEYEKKNKLTIQSDKQFEDFLMDNKNEWWSILIRGARWLFNSMPLMHLPGISFSRSNKTTYDNSSHDHQTKIFNNQK